MIAQSLITAQVVDGQIQPWWLTERDHPWLQALLDRRRALEGHPRQEWEAVLRTGVHAAGHPRKQALAAEILRRHAAPGRPSFPIHPRELRADLFRRAAVGDRSRETCVRETAQDLGLEPETVEYLLFQDLASQRVLSAVPTDLGPSALALSTNLALAQGLVARASRVELTLPGQAHRVVKAARLRGLICEVDRDAGPAGATVRLSGPLSLFHHTRLYGRALASLITSLPWSDNHRLEAHCTWKRSTGLLRLDASSPLPAGTPTKRVDGRLEARFARDFAKAAPDWALTQDPAPLRAGQGLVFPDFALRHREGLVSPALLEIVGFWTPEYLARKLQRYRQAGSQRLILAIDARHGVDANALPVEARVVRFGRRIDVAEVLAVLEARGA